MADGPQEKGETVARKLPPMMPLAQIHGTYIVAQSEDGFYLLDQHAAHERIYYEIYSKKLAEENHQQYPLLIPLTIECSPSEAEVLESRLDYLRRWGLEMEPFGGTTFVVRAYPTWFPREDAVGLIHEIIEWLKEHGKVDTAMLRDATAKMMSCKAAIKANRYLRREEMEKLLEQLNQCDNPFTCPHGRPIFVHFSTYELEKMFKRVM
jgi:DNA mismatch repair protein MutL